MAAYMKRTWVNFLDSDGNEVAPKREYAGHPARAAIVTRAERDFPGCTDVDFTFGTLKTGKPGDKWIFRIVRCGI